MVFRARVNIETAKKNYKPGEVIAEQLSDVDIAFLRAHGFIVEESEVFSDIGEYSAGYKDEAALQKMSKENILKYAKEIGLVLDRKMRLKDMVDSVLNYTEQMMAEGEVGSDDIQGAVGE